MYDEELVAYSRVLIERKKIEVKYKILRNRTTYDEDDKETLKKAEEFLENSKKIENKFNKILAEYNSNVDRYNRLNNQILWYKNSLPEKHNKKAEEDYL